MKAGVDTNEGLRPTSPWTGARGDLGWARSTVLTSYNGAGRSRTKAKQRSAIRITRRFIAPAAQVFAAWLERDVAGRWLFATASHPMAQVEIDARVEGSFCFVDRHNGAITEYTGVYIEIVPHRRLAFTLSTGTFSGVVTRVMVEITPLKKGCELTLTHEHVPPDLASHIECRWTGILYGLRATLESDQSDPFQPPATRSRS